MEVTYIDSMGDDNRVVDAARVSFSKVAENYTQDQNDRLIKYLASHGHWTPFAHPQITVREKVPIFVARQRFKHVQGFVYNEVSRRYVDDTPEFFYPGKWRAKADNKKQGSSDVEVTHIDTWPIEADYDAFVTFCLEVYEQYIKAGVAPEQARMVLPQSMYTEYYVTGSLSAWARAYKLRSEEHSQKEIQDLATEWDKIIRPLFPVSWSALTT